MPWPARLPRIATTQRCAISSSVAPARSEARRSDSSRAKRQLRTWPSAVSRTRSQSPQNGRVTEAMTPTVAGPPSTVNSSAGALPRGSTAGVRVNSRPERLEDLLGRDHRGPAPVVLGVERHLLDEPERVALGDRPPQQLGRLVVVDAAQQHRVDLDRGQAGGARRLETRDHVVEAVASGDRVEGLAADGVEADVDPVEAGCRERGRRALESQRVGGQADLERRVDGLGTPDDVDQAAPHERLPAGEADLAHPEPADADVDQPDDLVVGQHVVVREPLEALGRHAVGAPQVAAVGQRDPEVGRDPPVAVFQRDGVHPESLRADG